MLLKVVSLAPISSLKVWPVHTIKNIKSNASSSKQITLSIKYTTKMVRNYISNDIDLIQPTKYTVSKNRVTKKPLLKPEPLPPFKPLPIYNKNEYSKPNLPDYINNNDPW